MVVVVVVVVVKSNNSANSARLSYANQLELSLVIISFVLKVLHFLSFEGSKGLSISYTKCTYPNILKIKV